MKKYLNDCWSAYRYGDEIKLVYHKRGARIEGGKLPDCNHGTPSGLADGERLSQSISRTRSTVFEIAACNDFDWFCTLTVSAAKRDRYALRDFRAAFAQFVRNENRKRSAADKIEYLLIPEQHKDGAWHMHGLVRGLNESRDFARNANGYWDWTAYCKRFGYWSCSRVRSRKAVCRYITKYITKGVKAATALQAGAHSYYASQGLQRREPLAVMTNEPFPFRDDAFDFENDYVGVKWIAADSEEFSHAACDFSTSQRGER